MDFPVDAMEKYPSQQNESRCSTGENSIFIWIGLM